ncbi:conserved protein of unknown function [Pseudomonas marincola]|uniref:Zinc ribbon domain-containing protein n=1 Tax=Pseudomonas marincola TaxID=437900 RepID=A0A653E6A6_9PSED|nr:hypothetical protein [Pseudomonas marincola]CAE6906866.1 conserved protein of unknown function [Pseudomonas marincola]
MALIKCRECGGQISSKASACPGCGAKPKKSVGVIGWIFVIFIVLPVAWSIGTGVGKNNSENLAKSPALSVDVADKPKPLKWSKSEFKDAMTDQVTTVVSAKSTNNTVFEFPYNKAGGSRLTLSFRGKGSDFDAYFRIDEGQMQCSYRDCRFSIRVSDGPVQKWTGLQSTTNDSDLMFVRDAKQLEKIVKSGKPFRVGIEFYKAGERVFEFEPDGYPGI